MRSLLILASTLTILSGSIASAQDFKVSNPNAAPGDLGPTAIYTGTAIQPATVKSGYNAADDFGLSELNDLPDGVVVGSEAVDASVTTSSIAVTNRYLGYNASDSFSPSYGN